METTEIFEYIQTTKNCKKAKITVASRNYYDNIKRGKMISFGASKIKKK